MTCHRGQGGEDQHKLPQETSRPTSRIRDTVEVFNRVARESVAIISRCDSGIATAGAAAHPNLTLQKLRLSLRCSDRHPVVERSTKDTAGTLLVEGPARSIGSSTGCGAQEERWSLEGWFPGGFATTVILRPLLDLHWSELYLEIKIS